jgi:cardiolipin synthase
VTDAMPPARTDRIWTVPNALSALRLLGVPLFLYWVLGPHHDGRAVLLLVLAGLTDYLDGWVARRFGQFSRLGQLLDPAADRLYIAATVLALVARDGLPLWWALVLLGRDVALLPTLPLLRRLGYGPLPVHFLGKAATLNLLYAFPMLLVALPGREGWYAELLRPFAWAFVTWGSVLYLLAGWFYLVQVRQLAREGRTA